MGQHEAHFQGNLKLGTDYVDLILTLIVSQDLKQQKFVIEAEPSETVCIQYPRNTSEGHQSNTVDTSSLLTAGIAEQIGEVKEKITKEKGWEASTQKLIYSGAYE